MHVSGALLLLTFVVPPFWMVDAGYAAPSGGPTGDAPFLLLLTVPLFCAGFHAAVQIPAGLLGARLGGRRTAPVAYGSAVAVAGVLSLLLLWAAGWGAGPVWADAMVRAALGLAGYVWVVRARPGAQPGASALPRCRGPVTAAPDGPPPPCTSPGRSP
ncbi:hypothetical protein [Streptomyces caelestis]|uniref:hypothetical protein n=1 Tax=Streptomyces caelestis TaxID=36816 RepID=UPI00364B0ED1